MTPFRGRDRSFRRRLRGSRLRFPFQVEEIIHLDDDYLVAKEDAAPLMQEVYTVYRPFPLLVPSKLRLFECRR